jgi:hydrogenase maturation factor
MSEPAAEDAHCITCGDVAVALRVLECDGTTALCADAQGVGHSVAIDLVDGASAGDELLVHAGVAIRRLGAPA